MPAPVDIESVEDFQNAARQHRHAIVFFSAIWSEPCAALWDVFTDLAAENGAAHFMRIAAEDLPEISQQFNVTAVPTVVFLTGGAATGRIDGFNPDALCTKAAAHGAGAQGGAPDAGGGDAEARLQALVRREPVMLFMKGSPDVPRCGFSRKVVDALRGAGVQFGHFDILTDEAVRQGLKALSRWPTYPQLYAGGELLGGCDIVLELARENELRGEVDEALAKEREVGGVQAGQVLPEAEAPIEQRIRQLLESAPVLLFMKGAPDAPRCGFSRQVVQALRADGIAFKHFDILTDEGVRQGLKEYSSWPTYPQLYAKGELLGGCDIVLELAREGGLKGEIEGALSGAAA